MFSLMIHIQRLSAERFGDLRFQVACVAIAYFDYGQKRECVLV